MKKQKIEPAIVKLAIEELQSKNQKVSVAAVSKETGYPIPTLYASGLLKEFITSRPQVILSTKQINSASFYKKTAIEQSVDGYAEEIKNSYFFHPELVSDVKAVMEAMHIEFQPILFDRAINGLQVIGHLAPHPFKTGYLVSTASTEEEPSNPGCGLLHAGFMIYDALANEFHYYAGAEDYELKIEELMSAGNINIKTFKAHEIIRMETIRKRIDGGAA